MPSNTKVTNIVLALLFGLFFAVLESIVVIYLRQLPTLSLSSAIITLNLGFIAFIKPVYFPLLQFELIREFSTLVLILIFTLSLAKTIRLRFAYYFLTFAVWDLFYYVFLKLFINWPQSLFDSDIFFLFPVAWIGPVITPVVICTILIVSSLIFITKTKP